MILKNIRGLCENLWILRWNSFLCNALLSSDPSPQQATRAREQSYPHQGALVLIAIFSHQIPFTLLISLPLSLSFAFVSLLIFFIFLSFFFFFPFPSLFLSLLPVFSSLLQVQKQKTKNKIIYGFMPNICLSKKIQIMSKQYMALCPQYMA